MIAATPCGPLDVRVDFWKGRLEMDVEPSVVGPEEEFVVRVRSTDAEGQRTGSGLPAGEPSCTTTAITHGIPIAEIGVRRS